MLLGCNFLMVFFSMTYFMLLPGFAKDVLDAGPDRLGLLISVSGVGSLAGSLLIASMTNNNRARVLLSGALLPGNEHLYARNINSCHQHLSYQHRRRRDRSAVGSRWFSGLSDLVVLDSIHCPRVSESGLRC